MANLLLLLCLALLTATAAATQFTVGGSSGWSVPGDNAMSYKAWAERNRFKIGDSLLFVYPPQKDSVLQVEKEAYDSCNTTSFIRMFDDGNTVFKLDRSGPFYFISGIEANCMRNESLLVVVMTDRKHASVANPPSLPPSPSPDSLAYAPTPEASTSPSSPPTSTDSISPPASPPTSTDSTSPPSPPPSPTDSTSPPPPPESSTEPSTAPAGQDFTPPNGASIKTAGIAGFIGAFIGALIVL